MKPIIIALQSQAFQLWADSKLADAAGDSRHGDNLRDLAKMAAKEADSIAIKSPIKPVKKTVITLMQVE